MGREASIECLFGTLVIPPENVLDEAFII